MIKQNMVWFKNTPHKQYRY